MAVTSDIKKYEYGTEGGVVAYPIAEAQQLYQGCVALLSGGTGATKGYLKNGNASVTSTDSCVGIVGPPAGGTLVATGPGVLGGATDGAVWDDVQTGAFFIQSGTGADQLSVTTNGQTVYYGGENNYGPIACAVVGSPARPVLGTQLPQDPGIAGNFTPGSNYWPIKLNTVGGP